MKPLKPIAPIRAVRTIGEIVLRPIPSRSQLRLWLLFARQKARERAERKSAARQAAAAPAEASAPGPGSEGASVSPEYGHVDKRV
jgi:hypothetical protein